MLSTNIAGLELKCCIYNASGPRTYSVEALKKIAESRSGAVLAKSATLEKFDGNVLPRHVNKIGLGAGYGDGSINSEGLPNFGIDYYFSEEVTKQIASLGKPYIVSLSGFCADDNIEMLQRVLAAADKGSGISAVELNLACPNIPGKPIVAYDFEQVDALLHKMHEAGLLDRVPLGVKLAPYFDSAHVKRVVEVLAKYPIRFVATCNSIPNGLFVDVEGECEGMAANHGLGGLGGGFVKHTALANVRLLSTALQEAGRHDVDVVGVGGVSTGEDAFAMILCGAKAVQIGTCHWTEGPRCFARIAGELEALMRRKKYSTIEDFRGKLKPYAKSERPDTVNGSATAKAGKNARQMVQLYLLTALIAAVALCFGYSSTRGYFKH
jgi:dihydroorotate dehydrogenase (fumarate)